MPNNLAYSGRKRFRLFYVYRYQNKTNSKNYIGKAKDLAERARAHEAMDGSSPAFHGAIRKYGIAGFNFDIMGHFCTEQEAFAAEVFYIALYKTNINRYGNQYGYNLTDGGEGISGYRHTSVMKRYLSVINLGSSNHFFGKRHTDKSLAIMSMKSRAWHSNNNHPLLGTTMSEENRVKHSVRLKKMWEDGIFKSGRKFSEETRRKLSESHKGQPGFWTGKKLSAEHKLKLSVSHKGQESHMKGKTHSLESRAKMSQALKGRFLGEDGHNAKLTMKQANDIRRLYATDTFTYEKLGKLYGVGRTTIYRIIANTAYIDAAIPALTSENISEINKLVADGKSNRDIARICGVAKSIISKIRRGDTNSLKRAKDDNAH